MDILPSILLLQVTLETLNGSTPLIRGSMAAAEGACALLIQANADPQTETKFGETALQMAVVAEDPTAIMTLIKCKAEVDHVTSRGMTPLIRSAILNKPRSATVLRLAGCQINLETRKCGTATEVASHHTASLGLLPYMDA
jgi:ankyrin repeat protein